MARWRARNPLRAIFKSKRSSARRRGIPFAIRFEDIRWPERCPALGTPLDYRVNLGHKRDPRTVPSFDRVNNDEGYVPGNVQIISNAANKIKNQFTAAEIRRVADWLELVASD